MCHVKYNVLTYIFCASKHLITYNICHNKHNIHISCNTLYLLCIFIFYYLNTARTAAVGTGAATTTLIAGSSGSSSTIGTTTVATTSAGRAITGGATMGSIATSRAASTSIGTAATVGGIASELGSTSVESTVGINAVLDSASSSTTTILADVQGAMSGVEDVILGDATTSDAIISGAQSSSESIAGGVGGDVLSVAAGDAGVGVLSMLPTWLVSGGLAVLASELAFAVFAIFILLRAGGSAAKDVIVNSKTNEEKMVEALPGEEIPDIETQEVTSEENEEHVEL